MKVTATCLIEKNPLLREGVKKLLADTNYAIAETHPDIIAARNAPPVNDVALVISGLEDGASNLKEHIRAIKDLYPNSRLVLMSASTDLEFISTAFAEGADGFFTRDILPASLLNSLNMVMMGEKICPTFVLTMLMEKRTRTGRKPGESKEHALSNREMQILKHLASGQTNKQIALNQDIAEATVKVHVKAILRKLSLSNRTQAAIWALNEGLVS